MSNDGTSKSYTLGHRKHQGLARDAAGRIWSTEHVPRAGDELNLVVEGSNYGWPWRTYGVEYSLRRWPSLRAPDSAWKEPGFSFVPSRGISNLIAVRSARFPDWKGDLLIGTLRVREMLRLRLAGDRDVCVEEIGVGDELRDLEETADGSIVAWTDQGVLLGRVRNFVSGVRLRCPFRKAVAVDDRKLIHGLVPGFRGVNGVAVQVLERDPLALGARLEQNAGAGRSPNTAVNRSRLVAIWRSVIVPSSALLDS